MDKSDETLLLFLQLSHILLAGGGTKENDRYKVVLKRTEQIVESYKENFSVQLFIVFQ